MNYSRNIHIFPTILSLLSLSHALYPPLSVSVLFRSLLPLSPALPAVTAYLCELMIYHLLIHADYGAFHTALIYCWARFSLHSCQLSFRQPANRPVPVSQLQNHHWGLLCFIYTSMHAQAYQWQSVWYMYFGPSTCWNVRLKDQIKVMFWKCSFTKSLYSRSASLAEGRDMWRCSYRRRLQLKSNLSTKDPETIDINFVTCSFWLKIKHIGCFVTSFYLFDLTSWSLNINILVSRSMFCYHVKSTTHTVRTKSRGGDASLWLIQHFL